MWDELMFEAHVFFVYINITLSFTFRAWAQPILILMTMKYVCRIVLMMLLFACQVSMKAVVVFEAERDREVNNSVTKDGITISGLSVYGNNYLEELPVSYGTSEFTVTSEVGNISMIALCNSPYPFSVGEATNSWQGDFCEINNHYSKSIIDLKKLDNIDVSVGSIEEGIWRGASSSIHFILDNVAFLDAIYIYVEGEELPVKKPYAVSEYFYSIDEDEYVPEELYSSLNICYGYSDFVRDYTYTSEGYVSRLSVFKNDIIEGRSLPKFSSSRFGLDVDDFGYYPKKYEYDEIFFSDSFTDYHPTNISHMFQGIDSYNSVNFSNLVLSQVNDASYMFKISDVNVENLRISECKNLSYMFSGYSNEYLDISSWDFSNNTVVTAMFSNSKIKHLKIGSSINNTKDDIFKGLGTYDNPCKLEIDGNVNLDQVEGNNVFQWKGGYFKLSEKEAYVSVEEVMMGDEYGEFIGYIYTFRYDNNRHQYEKTFSVDEEIGGMKKWVADFESNSENWEYDAYDEISYHSNNCYVTISPSFADYRPTSTKKWFYCLYAKQDVLGGLEYLNTSEVTDMSDMFAESGFKILDISHFDTSKVTDMSYMFFRCNGLTSLDMSHFNTSKVTNMSYMFYECCQLKSLDLSNFDTSNVTDMSLMFSADDTNQLEFLDVSSFNTSNVTNMSGMFGGCSRLTSLDVSNFNTTNATSMGGMFWGCSNLKFLDVSNFNTSKVTNMYEMFFNCKNLTSLDVSNFDTSNLVEGDYIGSSEMFANCTSLQDLSISSTMSNIRENACQRVGTKDKPCTIYAPYGFDFGTDTTQPYFQWKSGYFVKGTVINTYAVGDTITYEGLQYEVTKVDDEGNEVKLIKNPDAQGEINILSVITDESGTIGFTVTAIVGYAFYNCANITKLSIPATVRSIGTAITSCCTILNQILVDLDNPYYDSREYCNAIINTATGELIAGCNKTTIPEGVTAIGTEAMRGMFDLEGIVLPSTLTRIGNRAFYYCKKLTGHLAIPEGVTEVATYAFYKCTGLTAISLPSTISTMGSCAFRECSNVTWVSCYAVTPPSIDSRMFGKFSGCTLMVPIASVDTYKAAANWKKFDPIIRESIVSVEDVTILTGNRGTARISLDNGTNVYTGCQFNITLPEGTDLVKQTHGGYEYTISNRFSGTPSVQITPQDDGSYMILIYSMNNTTINGSEGELISLPIKANTDLSIGSYPGTITNVTFNNPDNTSAYLHDVTFNITVPSFVLGDVNHDRTVNITDVMMTVNHVVGQTPAGFHVENADVNGDHVINISDIMAIVNLVVNATSANAPAHAREAMTDAISLMPTNQGYAVSLQNTEPYTALQMDIQMDDDSPLTAHLMDNRSDGHSIVCSDLGNGHHRIVIYSFNGYAIKGNDGILLQLETNGKHEALPEIYNVQLTNNIFENVTLSDISFPTDITIVNMEGATDAPVYNVQGIHAPKHYRGIIIQDGRKHVEKK